MMLKVTPPTLTSTVNVETRRRGEDQRPTGAGLLFDASIQLIFESRIALLGTCEETDSIRSINKDHAPKEEERESGWRMFR